STPTPAPRTARSFAPCACPTPTPCTCRSATPAARAAPPTSPRNAPPRNGTGPKANAGCCWWRPWPPPGATTGSPPSSTCAPTAGPPSPWTQTPSPRVWPPTSSPTEPPPPGGHTGAWPPGEGSPEHLFDPLRPLEIGGDRVHEHFVDPLPQPHVRVASDALFLESRLFVGADRPHEKAGFKKQGIRRDRSEEHTSELQSRFDLVCRLLLE